MIRFEPISPASRDLSPMFPPTRVVMTSMGFGEGPLWDASSGSLIFSDIVRSKMWRWSEAGGATVVADHTGHANGLAFDREGRIVAAGWSSRTVWRLEPDGSRTVLASNYQGMALNTPNDLVVTHDGTILFTDSDGGLFIPGMEGDDLQRYLPFSGVYAILPSGELRLLSDDCLFPNGISFTPDGRTLLVSDTHRAHVRAFTVGRDFALTDSGVFYELTGSESGHADGMTFDALGNLYCTGPGGVHLISPSGDLIARLLIPEDCTNMAWGGANRRTLFITTFRSVFAVEMQVAGMDLQEVAV